MAANEWPVEMPNLIDDQLVDERGVVGTSRLIRREESTASQRLRPSGTDGAVVRRRKLFTETEGESMYVGTEHANSQAACHCVVFGEQPWAPGILSVKRRGHNGGEGVVDHAEHLRPGLTKLEAQEILVKPDATNLF